MLHHSATWGKVGPYTECTRDGTVRDQHILSTTLPLLSGVLSPGAGLRMDLTWGMSAFVLLDTCLHSLMTQPCCFVALSGLRKRMTSLG